MNSICPECETELDQSTGVCPACRWDPDVVAPRPTKVPRVTGSISERYRGTPYDTRWDVVASSGPAVSRARVFVITALLMVVGVYAVMLAVMGVN